ncbi:MAG: hypothetical protein HY094_05805 [Candidatus Melainabacteria bacterium]|nr:hypothetical protein [Candidatus Melainabacteria bacterium]
MSNPLYGIKKKALLSQQQEVRAYQDVISSQKLDLAFLRQFFKTFRGPDDADGHYSSADYQKALGVYSKVHPDDPNTPVNEHEQALIKIAEDFFKTSWSNLTGGTVDDQLLNTKSAEIQNKISELEGKRMTFDTEADDIDREIKDIDILIQTESNNESNGTV